jgi:MoxR-like ATPase
VRKTTGRLPESEIVFLDEVWKGSSAICNTLLTVLNEKRFANGGSVTALPLISCFGASNEIPEGEGMDPIWDRFMIRHEMTDIAEDDNFVTMLAAPAPAPIVASVDLAAEQAATAAVSVPVEVLRMMATLRRALAENGFHASPRRWRKSLTIIQANAHFEGRTVAEMDDLEVLEHVLWRAPKERAAIARVIGEKVNPDGAKATAHADKCANLWDGLTPAARNAPTPADIAALSEAMADVARIQGEAGALKPSRKVDAERAKIAAIHVQLQTACMRAAGVKM